MALSRNVLEIFYVREYNDLEIRIRGHSRSSKATPFDSLHMISYYRPIVTLCLECTVFEILRHWPKIAKKLTLLSFDAPCPANPREYPHKPYFSRNSDLWATFCR